MSIPIFFSGSRASAWTPRNLFAAGEQGAWYDPSDFSALFQDAAGTTPVTAVEQPVGKMLDKSGRGNHATASADANRPTLSARYNLLTKTEQFDDAAWQYFTSGLTYTANYYTAPDGTQTGDKVVADTSGAARRVRQNITPILKGVTVTCSVWVKSESSNYIKLWITDGVTDIASVMQQVGTTWTKLTCTGTTSASASEFGVLIGTRNANDTAYADGTWGVWGADLRVANDSLIAPAYQRVNTSTDYDTSGFPPYLAFNGTSSAMATGSIDFTATDKMTVFAGARKYDDTNFGAIAELTSDSDTTNGGFYLGASGYNNVDRKSWALQTRGTVARQTSQARTYTAPITSIVSAALDNGAATDVLQIAIRINGGEPGSYWRGNGPTSAGNYANAALYLGARGGSSLWFIGRLYSLIVRGAATSAADIVRAESYCNVKSGRVY